MFLSQRVHQTSLTLALAGVLFAGTGPAWLHAQTAAQPAASHFDLPPTEPSEIALPLPEDRGQADLEQTLQRLGTTASVLMIVAHPDDEDGALLTWLSRGMGARATLFTLTRGEGGQNAMTADTYDALGLKEQIVFPEIDYDKIDEIRGMDIIICTTARTDKEARALLDGFNLPFTDR